jgi:hypothetical protein
MRRFFPALGLLLFGLATSTAMAQTQAQVSISSPVNGATVPGPDVTVTINVSGTTLVPAAQATRLEDLHVHYLLDTDPSPWLGGATPIPAGDPNIVHSGSTSNTFTGLAPGAHRVVVILGFSDHRAVQPPVDPSVSFTVAGRPSAPAQLPRTGDAANLPPLLLAVGVVGLVLGSALRGLGRLGLGHRR